MPSYRVFFAYNFGKHAGSILQTVNAAAADADIELCPVKPGSVVAAPQDGVLEKLQTTEALLVVLRNQTAWIANEIGMAFALRLPIAIIVDQRATVGGIGPRVTSFQRIPINDRRKLREALSSALPALVKAIQDRRAKAVEFVPSTGPVYKVSWETYYDLIKAAHGHLMHDAGDRHAYKPTLLIGISRGGIIVADLLSRIGNLPMAILYADRTSHDVRYDRVALQHVVEAHVKSQAERRARLLLVDDVMKSGRSLINARALLDELAAALANGGAPVEVQSLVLFKRAGHTKDIIEPEHVMSDYSRKMEILLPYGLG